MAPYIGLLLKVLDPAIPFVLTATTLVLATLGISRVERIARNLPEQDRQPLTGKPPNNRTAIALLLLGTLIGSAALLWVAAADSLETLIAAQMLAGGAWGAVFTTGVSSALGLGTSGREGLVLGLLFTMLSLATLTRAGLVTGGIKASPEYIETL